MGASETQNELVVRDPDQFTFWQHYHHEDNPANRIAAMCHTGHHSMYREVIELHHALVPATFEYPRTGLVTFKRTPDGELFTRLGLDFASDFQDILAPFTATLSQEIADSDLAEEEKLRRLANLGGMLVAQAQMFSNGNNRTARAFYGFIRYGTDGIIPAYNAWINFGPPDQIEKLVLSQNRERLKTIDTELLYSYPLGGIAVSDAAVHILAAAQTQVDALRMSNPRPSDPSLKISHRMGHIERALFKQVPNKEVVQLASATLLQADYGPAAYSLLPNAPGVRNMDESTLVGLYSLGRLLLRMRMMSLLTGIAAAGKFVALKPSQKPDKAYEYSIELWEPTDPSMSIQVKK